MDKRSGMSMKLVRVTRPGASDAHRTPPGSRDGEADALRQMLSMDRPTPHQPAYLGQGIELQCDDGHRARLGEGGALLTGRSQARDRVYSALLTNVLSAGGSVILLTGSSGESAAVGMAREVARTYGQPMRRIDRDSGTPGFSPLAGWPDRSTENFFCKRIATTYAGHNARPTDAVRQCYNGLMRLAGNSEEAASLLLRGVENVARLLECCERASLPRDELDRMARRFRDSGSDCMQAAQIIGDYLRAFAPVCQADPRGERYSLFSPGLTVLTMNDQAVQEPGSLPWYLCQMAGMISEVAPAGATLVVDGVSPAVLEAFSGVLLNASVRLVAVCDNYTAFGNAEQRSRFNGRFAQQFVFTQLERESADYWSSLTEGRKVLVRTYTDTAGDTRSFFQLPSRSDTKGKSYAETFRRELEVSHFTGLSPLEGELLEADSGTGCIFHHFKV